MVASPLLLPYLARIPLDDRTYVLYPFFKGGDMAPRRRKQKLQATVAAIQARWGERAIAPAREQKPLAGLPSGIATLDALLPGGGFPRGALSELCGYGTCGHLPIAARVLAQAQLAAGRRRDRQQALVVDAERSLDLATLARCGVQMESLAILRAQGLAHALQMTGDLLRSGFAGALLFDRLRDLYALADGETLQRLEQALRDWGPLLNRSGTPLLWLTELSAPGLYPEGLPLAFAASVRVLCERQRWITEGQRVTGYVSQVTLLKSRGGQQGASLALSFKLA
jgi:RecA/RadA recombinase